jgi:predicted NAD-dependent protein-ADP-ribosyltransferase YbiA (DUF1768 family)
MDIFDNFYVCKFRLDGWEWYSSEHAYQALKFKNSDPDHYTAIRLSETAREAYNKGQDRTRKMEPNFDKYHAMLRCNLAKFIQNRIFAKRLIQCTQIKYISSTKHWNEAMKDILMKVKFYLKEGVIQIADYEKDQYHSYFNLMKVRIPQNVMANISYTIPPISFSELVKKALYNKDKIICKKGDSIWLLKSVASLFSNLYLCQNFTLGKKYEVFTFLYGKIEDEDIIYS